MSAWSRHHRSGGFGIHSPYAYRFVRTVLRERKHYYAYQGLGELISTVKQNTTSSQRREIDLISKREARLLFRVTNFFNPHQILQIGAATGIESITMLEVRSDSRLWLYDPNIEHNALAVRVLQSQMDRVACYDDVQVAVDEFLQAEGEREVLANVPVEEAVLKRFLDAGAVLIMRNLHRNEAMWTLFEACCDYMPMGQTYTNGKIAILNPNPKLQREDFLLWL